jgi:hypothetical protein
MNKVTQINKSNLLSILEHDNPIEKKYIKKNQFPISLYWKMKMKKKTIKKNNQKQISWVNSS